MIKTFIYGNPHGFDLYEMDSAYNDYVKGFYISSRKGRRMMVNRRENGETTYNYLRYGLHEAIDRPTNAFFGMTLVVDGNQYCADFRKILEWFDYIFERIVKERNIFLKDESGQIVTPLKYRIHKFEEDTADMEWVKSNLPNIFSHAAGTTLTVYDSSFIVGKTGQVVGVNEEETVDNILKMFKRYSWITLSQQYPLLPVSAEQNIDGVAELNYTDLKIKIDDFNKRLVPIATGVNEGSTEELFAMHKESKESFDLLAGYLKDITDDKEKDLFNGLTHDYHSFVESISALLSKRASPDNHVTTPFHPKTQYCFNCKKEKDPSHFSSPDATKCIECEEEEQREAQKGKKQCIKCGKYKSINQFSNGSNVCTECQEQEATQTKTCRHCGKKKPLSDFPLNSDTCNKCSHSTDWKKIIHNSLYLMIGVVALFAVVGCLYWYITSDVDNSGNKAKDGETEVVEERKEEKNEENKVSVAILNQYLAKGDFTNAYKYIIDKQDKANYHAVIANSIDNYLWRLIESKRETIFENIKTSLEIEIRPISSLLTEVGLDENYITKLQQDARSFAEFQTIITKTTITEAEYYKGLTIISTIGDKLKDNWKEALETKMSATEALAQGKKTETETKGEVRKTGEQDITITIERLDSETLSTLSTENYTAIHNGIDGYVSTFLVICGNGTGIHFGQDCPFQNNRMAKDKVRVKLEREGSFTYKCGNKDITITAKRKPNRQ